MNKAEDLTNKTYGHWYVIEKDKTVRKQRMSYWMCRCMCGKIQSVPMNYLKSAKNPKCMSCAGRNKVQHIMTQHYLNMKSRCKKKDIVCNISKDDMLNQWNKQLHRCAITNIILTLPKTHRTMYESTASLDRIDSSKGYEINNIQWVHKDINTMKMDLNQEQFINYCNLIAKQHPRNI